MESKEFPRHVDILGVRYRIAVEKGELNRDHLGLCKSFQAEIYLDSEVKGDMQRAVILHEIFHAISDGVGARLDESQVSAMSRGLFDMMKDNPGMVEWLMEYAYV
jgi:hypothetical protein